MDKKSLKSESGPRTDQVARIQEYLLGKKEDRASVLLTDDEQTQKEQRNVAFAVSGLLSPILHVEFNPNNLTLDMIGYRMGRYRDDRLGFGSYVRTRIANHIAAVATSRRRGLVYTDIRRDDSSFVGGILGLDGIVDFDSLPKREQERLLDRFSSTAIRFVDRATRKEVGALCQEGNEKWREIAARFATDAYKRIENKLKRYGNSQVSRREERMGVHKFLMSRPGVFEKDRLFMFSGLALKFPAFGTEDFHVWYGDKDRMKTLPTVKGRMTQPFTPYADVCNTIAGLIANELIGGERMGFEVANIEYGGYTGGVLYLGNSVGPFDKEWRYSLKNKQHVHYANIFYNFAVRYLAALLNMPKVQEAVQKAEERFGTIKRRYEPRIATLLNNA